MALLNLPESVLRERTSMKWRTFAPDILPLWVAEMDVEQHPAVQEALVDAVRRGDTGYPSGRAYAEAYAALVAARWGADVAPDQIRRSGDVMNAMLAVLLGNTAEGDHIVINPPIYPPFRQIVTGYGRQITEVPLAGDGRLDVDGLEAAFTGPERPTAYLLCSPHNPNGTLHTPTELATVGRLCSEHGVLLVVDEIHAPLVDPGETFTSVLALEDAQEALVAFSAGKGWNLAALKGGVLVRGTRAKAPFDRLPPLTHQSTGHLATIAHTAALTHALDWVDELMVEVAANKALLVRLVDEMLPGVIYTPSPATYLAWIDCTGLALPRPRQHFLTQAKVALNDGADFAADRSQFVRMNLAASPQIITEAVERMAASLSSHV